MIEEGPVQERYTKIASRINIDISSQQFIKQAAVVTRDNLARMNGRRITKEGFWCPFFPLPDRPFLATQNDLKRIFQLVGNVALSPTDFLCP